MADLIDREELEKSILKWLPSEDYDPEKSGLRFDEDLVVSLMMEIEEQPTVDAVLVVRCKDCLWANTNLFAKELGIVYCNNYGKRKKQDDFCSEGERRGD